MNQKFFKIIMLLVLNIGVLIAGNYSYPVSNYTPGSYDQRKFLSPSNHLGEDIKLSFNTPIYAIGSGTIKRYGSATGYGTLVVAIEHDLKRNETFNLKNGQRKTVKINKFVSIYGHLYKGNLSWKVGQKVNKGDLIGYIQENDKNGDGREHLHFGIFLGQYTKAIFGYTSSRTDGLYKYARAKYFASGKEFITLLNQKNDLKVYDFWQSSYDGIYKASCYKGDWILDAQFKVKNNSDKSIYIEKLALAMHDTNENYLFDLAVRDVYQTLYKGSSLHFDIANAYLTNPGEYKLIAKAYYNDKWHDLSSLNLTVIENNSCPNPTNPVDEYIENFYNMYPDFFGTKVNGPYDCYTNYRCVDYDTGYKIAAHKQDYSLHYKTDKWYKYSH